jgi:hypothetical protein
MEAQVTQACIQTHSAKKKKKKEKKRKEKERICRARKALGHNPAFTGINSWVPSNTISPCDRIHQSEFSIL